MLYDGFAIDKTFEGHFAFWHIKNNVLMLDSLKPTVFVKLKCAGIIGMKIDRFAGDAFFQCMEQRRTDTFDFCIWVSRQENDFSIWLILL